jgi:hypothetical protein
MVIISVLNRIEDTRPKSHSKGWKQIESVKNALYLRTYKLDCSSIRAFSIHPIAE